MSARYRFDHFELRVPERELYRNGVLLSVEPKVFDLLAYLVAHRDRAVGRDELIAGVWGRVDVADTTVAQAILRLRRVLDEGARDAVRTVPRHGYRWVAPTEVVAVEPAAPVPTPPAPQATAALAHIEATGADAAPAILASDMPGTRSRRARLSPLVLAGGVGLAIAGAILWAALGGVREERPRLAILPGGSSASGSTRLDDLGALELLRRDLVAAPEGPVVLTIDAVARALADPAVQGEDAAGLPERLRRRLGASDVLVVDVQRIADGVSARAVLHRADGDRTLRPVRDTRLDRALGHLADATRVELGRKRGTAAVVQGTDALAQALALQAQGRVRDAHAVLERLNAATPGDAEILSELGRTDCALEAYEACGRHIAEALASPTIDDWQRANAHLLLARRHLDLDEDAAAAVEVASADAAAAATSDHWLQARALQLRQRLAMNTDDDAKAQELARRALTLYRLVGDAASEADVEHDLGRQSAAHGRFDDALSHYRASLQLSRTCGDRARETRALSTISKAFGASGRYREANDAAREALAAAELQQDPAAIRSSLLSSAWASIQVGKLSDARETVHRALLSAPDTARASMYALLGIIDAAGGRYRNATASWGEALAIGRSSDPDDPMAAVHLGLAYAALNDGDIETARNEAAKLADISRTHSDASGFADHAAAMLAAHDGQIASAAERYRRVWRAARSNGSLNQQMLADYSDVLFRQGDLAEVEALLGEPTLPAQEGYLYQLVKARYLLRRGQDAAARAAFDRALELAGERFHALIDVTRGELAPPAAGAHLATR
ncbi:MAG TPA: winged helix-turn-helix domain-containing protein [Dokdonella sp.]|nr:winged helix-turn-helix domain-containing protein [Dokdonella sp.]